jgi:hypothetical protein
MAATPRYPIPKNVQLVIGQRFAQRVQHERFFAGSDQVHHDGDLLAQAAWIGRVVRSTSASEHVVLGVTDQSRFCTLN